jgi:hypothetical protein
MVNPYLSRCSNVADLTNFYINKETGEDDHQPASTFDTQIRGVATSVEGTSASPVFMMYSNIITPLKCCYVHHTWIIQ